MQNRFLISLATLLLCLTVLSACSREPEATVRSVWVSILPQKYFAELLCGDTIRVDVLLRPGQSPEMYSPSAAELARVSKADLYFGIGMPVELALLHRLESSMQGVRFVQTGKEPNAHEHHHEGESHDHDSEEVDPHIWMDPLQMIEVVAQMRDALAVQWPEAQADFTERAATLTAELSALDAELQKQLAPHKGRAFIINHPSLGNFAERYGLQQLSIESAGSTPSARRVADLVSMAKGANVGVILTQPEFGRSSAEVLGRELKIPVVEINPLAEDYFANLRGIADAIASGFDK